MDYKTLLVAFAATEKLWEDVIPQLVEMDGTKDYVLYGKDNQYPE